MKYKKIKTLFCLIPGLILPFSVLLSSAPPTAPVKVEMVTEYGTIRFVLYNETPLHRDNFVKLIREHYYDSLLFHRVIQNFMIQGGDPDSKSAPDKIELGNGGPPYTIPAEYNPAIYHKRGVLAAARESDLDNPSQASSASQFYIVQGRVYTDSLLKVQAGRITRLKLFNEVINRPENKVLLEKYKNFTKEQITDSVKMVTDIIRTQVDKELPSRPLHTFSDEQRKTYTTVGGTPHLDMSYTIFGEVTEGMDIVDKIAEQKVDERARPLRNIRILKVSIIP